MDWSEFLSVTNLDKGIEVAIINPVRNGDIYKTGRMTGYKSGVRGGGHYGVRGGGHYNYKKGEPHSFSSQRIRWIKKPKVHVTYNCFDFGRKEHSDWIDVDNCRFKIKSEEK